MKKLLIICGGMSSEREVSRMSCNSVISKIHEEKYAIGLVGIDGSGKWFSIGDIHEDLTSPHWLDEAVQVTKIVDFIQSFDVVLPVMHGMYGEDGDIQGLCEMANVPYVGCRVLASSVCMDKIYTKKILSTANIPQVKSIYVKKRYDGKFVAQDLECNETEDIAKTIQQTLGFPVFIKASRSGSSVGCYKCKDETELMKLIEEAAQYDRHIVVEECIDCIELETAVLGNDDITVSRVGQIMPHGEFYTYESKYEDEESKTCIPALVDASIQEEIRNYAVTAFKAVDGHGLARVDFFYDKKTGKVYLNEINTFPGFTKISMYPKLMEDAGISYSDLIDQLIHLAFER